MDTAMMPVVASSNTVGRPTKYETHVLPRIKDIEQWVRDGMTDYSIADELGISPTTLIEYKKECVEIIEAYQRARTHRNCLVMNKMYTKATTETVTLSKQKVTKDGDVIDIVEEVYIGPDVNAADLFLRNNDPDYKQAKQADSGQNITVNFQLPQLEQDLAQIAEKRKSLEALLHRDYEVIE